MGKLDYVKDKIVKKLAVGKPQTSISAQKGFFERDPFGIGIYSAIEKRAERYADRGIS